MASTEPIDALPMGRRERKKAETRQRLLRAAAGLFTEQGFEATTVDEIAERADVSRGTLFNYFPEKSALMAELGDGMADTFLQNMEEVRELDAPLAERLTTLFTASSERLEARPDLARAILYETIARRSSLDARRSATARLHDGFAQLLADGAERGDVRKDVPITLLGELVAGGYVEVLLSWLVDDEYPLTERLSQAAQVLAAAVAPPSGGRSSTRSRPARTKLRQRAPKSGRR